MGNAWLHCSKKLAWLQNGYKVMTKRLQSSNGLVTSRYISGKKNDKNFFGEGVDFFSIM